jgi:hypothetical protein
VFCVVFYPLILETNEFITVFKLGAGHLTFEGGSLKKNSCKAILNKKIPALTNWRGKYPAPLSIWWK